MTGFAALLFLAGGIATYLVPQLTAPFYIIGSGATLLHTVVDAWGDGRRSHRRSSVGTARVQLVAVATVLVLGFWLGFRFPSGL